jgi:cytochrome c oxidase subunit 3
LATTIKAARRTAGAGWTGGGTFGWSGGNGGNGGWARSAPQNGRLGMWFALASIMMLFMGLTSAFIVRRGLDPGWQPIGMPSLAPLNAVLLLASSVTLELGRRNLGRARQWLAATWILGLLFIAGQLLVWLQLAAAGLYLSNSPHSSFFYLLTALHGLHLAGGMAGLSWLLWMPSTTRATRERHEGVVALYWHFMDALWVYLLVLLFVWR